jgi:hypothetical protein
VHLLLNWTTKKNAPTLGFFVCYLLCVSIWNVECTLLWSIYIWSMFINKYINSCCMLCLPYTSGIGDSSVIVLEMRICWKASQGWSLWYAHSKTRKKSWGHRTRFEDMTSAICHLSPIRRHLDPFTSYRNNRNCSTVIEYFYKDPTKNVYLVIIYKKTWYFSESLSWCKDIFSYLLRNVEACAKNVKYDKL